MKEGMNEGRKEGMGGKGERKGVMEEGRKEEGMVVEGRKRGV